MNKASHWWQQITEGGCFMFMKLLLLFFVLLFSIGAISQTAAYDSVNRKRAQINRTGMAVLGGWALLNIGSGFPGQANQRGRQQQFYKTNIIWGSVNLLLAGVGYFREKRERSGSFGESFGKQAGTEKLFLFNTALDLGYAAFGLYLREKGKNSTGDKKDKLQGTGDSFLVQGAFLFLFDGLMYLIHAKNGTRLYPALKHLSLGATESGYGLVFRF